MTKSVSERNGNNLIKQRWRKTKKPMKRWLCDGCGDFIKITKEYEPRMCCSGFECGCYGMPINPIFCDKCLEKYFGKQKR
jgi:hypothetical protein